MELLRTVLIWASSWSDVSSYPNFHNRRPFPSIILSKSTSRWSFSCSPCIERFTGLVQLLGYVKKLYSWYRCSDYIWPVSRTHGSFILKISGCSVQIQLKSGFRKWCQGVEKVRTNIYINIYIWASFISSKIVAGILKHYRTVNLFILEILWKTSPFSRHFFRHSLEEIIIFDKTHISLLSWLGT
jgi:hypothetical protein